MTWLACILWLLTTTWLQCISRSDFYSLWSIYALTFASYAWLILSRHSIRLRDGLLLALVARMVSLFFDPLLSDDYYRFIWDGMLMHDDIHPMAYTPSYLMQHPEIATVNELLYNQLNSQNYYSVYPPVAQWIFRLSYEINGLHIRWHVVFFKILLIATDILITYLLYHLLLAKKQPTQRVLWYALNPLILLEFTGNLHMDGIMIAGLLGAVYLSDKKSMLWSSILMAFSVLSKLLTLILIPFMPRGLYWKKMILFSLLSFSLSMLILYASFGSHTGWMESVRLWFVSFEFNASMYYLARELGYWLTGYNTIGKTGPVLALITLCGIGLYWIRYLMNHKTEWSTAMLFVLTFYFLMATTVHPWYLASLLCLGILSNRFYPLVWTFLVFLSYSHYMDGGFRENYFLIATEYILLTAWIIWEWQIRKRQTSLYSAPASSNQ
jgi:alpha-1,6-mannosyltransferase